MGITFPTLLLAMKRGNRSQSNNPITNKSRRWRRAPSKIFRTVWSNRGGSASNSALITNKESTAKHQQDLQAANEEDGSVHSVLVASNAEMKEEIKTHGLGLVWVEGDNREDVEGFAKILAQEKERREAGPNVRSDLFWERVLVNDVFLVQKVKSCVVKYELLHDILVLMHPDDVGRPEFVDWNLIWFLKEPLVRERFQKPLTDERRQNGSACDDEKTVSM